MFISVLTKNFENRCSDYFIVCQLKLLILITFEKLYFWIVLNKNNKQTNTRITTPICHKLVTTMHTELSNDMSCLLLHFQKSFLVYQQFSKIIFLHIFMCRLHNIAFRTSSLWYDISSIYLSKIGIMPLMIFNCCWHGRWLCL